MTATDPPPDHRTAAAADAGADPTGPVRGGCLCGAIALEVRAFSGNVRFCHCTQCRKQSGHYYAAVHVDRDDLAVSGAERVRWYAASAEAERGFCDTCGSALFWRPHGTPWMAVMAGCLDAPTGLVADAHIFVDDKGDYYAIDDGLPRFPGSD